MERITKADPDSDVSTLIRKACFLSNCLHGSRILSSFELARGYTPSIVGNPAQKIPAEILHDHKRQTARRALHKLLRARNNKILTKNDVKTDDRVGYFYNSSKGNERAEWREGKVRRVGENMVEVATGKKGRDAKVAYEDLRLIPSASTVEKIMNEGQLLTAHGAGGRSMMRMTHRRTDISSNRQDRPMTKAKMAA